MATTYSPPSPSPFEDDEDYDPRYAPPASSSVPRSTPPPSDSGYSEPTGDRFEGQSWPYHGVSADPYAGNPGFYGTSVQTYPGSRMDAPAVGYAPQQAPMPDPNVGAVGVAPIDSYPAPAPYAGGNSIGDRLSNQVQASVEARLRERSPFSQAMADRRAAGQSITGPADIPFGSHPAADIFERYLRNVAPPPATSAGIDRAYDLMPGAAPAPSRQRLNVGGGASVSRSRSRSSPDEEEAEEETTSDRVRRVTSSTRDQITGKKKSGNTAKKTSKSNGGSTPY